MTVTRISLMLQVPAAFKYIFQKFFSPQGIDQTNSDSLLTTFFVTPGKPNSPTEYSKYPRSETKTYQKGIYINVFTQTELVTLSNTEASLIHDSSTLYEFLITTKSHEPSSTSFYALCFTEVWRSCWIFCKNWYFSQYCSCYLSTNWLPSVPFCNSSTTKSFWNIVKKLDTSDDSYQFYPMTSHPPCHPSQKNNTADRSLTKYDINLPR